jgi:hypothetical protein
MDRSETVEDKVTVKCPAIGARFISGIAKQYDDTYPDQLIGVISEKDFENTMEKLNDAIFQFWPCTTCFIFGFACAPMTLGTSLCCPRYCVSKAEDNLTRKLEDTCLMEKYREKEITWSLHKSCFNSWIEIQFPVKYVTASQPASRV